jgi:dTDP-4-dehydrorhamnose reductase
MRIFILGANGLLGSQIEAQFIESGLNLVHVSRRTFPDIEQELMNPDQFVQSLGAEKQDYIINALGVTRHRIGKKAPGANLSAVHQINSKLPFALGELSQKQGTKVIQIGTDCVFSGNKGDYVESDVYDAFDIYGHSKAIGESAPGIEVIRASSVAPSGGRGPQLWDWVKNQEQDSTISGYSDVFWNGVTAKIHAQLLVEIVKRRFPMAGTQHLVPANQISKDQLVRLIARVEGRNDINVQSMEVEQAKNMTLSTENESMNRELWKLIGFNQPPTIEELILEDSGSI